MLKALQTLIYDVSTLEHPKPLEIMTEALLKAKDGEILEMHHRMEPFLLYDIIKAQNLAYFTLKQENGNFIIYIAKKEKLKKFLLLNSINLNW